MKKLGKSGVHWGSKVCEKKKEAKGALVTRKHLRKTGGYILRALWSRIWLASGSGWWPRMPRNSGQRAVTSGAHLTNAHQHPCKSNHATLSNTPAPRPLATLFLFVYTRVLSEFSDGQVSILEQKFSFSWEIIRLIIFSGFMGNWNDWKFFFNGVFRYFYSAMLMY